MRLGEGLELFFVVGVLQFRRHIVEEKGKQETPSLLTLSSFPAKTLKSCSLEYAMLSPGLMAKQKSTKLRFAASTSSLRRFCASGG